MVEDDEDGEAFIRKFREQLSTINEFVQVVLNSHFEVESDLDDVLEAIFYDPERLEKAGLKFIQKVHVARAYTWNMGNMSDWAVMETLNTLRNEVTHKRRNEQATKIVRKLRAMLLVMGTDKFRRDVRAASAKDVVVYAAARCGGLLAYVGDHAKQMRKVLEEAAEGAEAGA
jgi:DNA repair ATPase RecN